LPTTAIRTFTDMACCFWYGSCRTAGR